MRESDSRVSTLFTAGLSVAGIVAVALIPQFPELLVALGAIAVGLWLAALLIWLRNRRKEAAPAQPTQAITGDRNVQIGRDGYVVTEPRRADLSVQRAVLSDCIAAGLVIKAEIDQIAPVDLFEI